jgi:hypothetical protein
LKTYKLTIPFYASLKTSAIIIAFISCAHASAQDTVKRLYFEKIRWTVEVPTEFKMLDSVTVEAQAREGGGHLLKADSSKLDYTKIIHLITASKTPTDALSVTITPFDPEIDGHYDSSNQYMMLKLYNLYKDKVGSMVRIDSLTSVDQIDGLSFTKYSLHIFINEKLVITNILWYRLYEGYDFGITYLYIDERTGKQIEAMLRASKFAK